MNALSIEGRSRERFMWREQEGFSNTEMELSTIVLQCMAVAVKGLLLRGRVCAVAKGFLKKTINQSI